MIARKHIIIGAIVAGLVVLELRRAHAATCKCGGKLQRMTLAEARTKFGAFKAWPDIERQIRSCGGVCLQQGTVADAGTRDIDDEDALDPDGDGQYLITQPWQVW